MTTIYFMNISFENFFWKIKILGTSWILCLITADDNLKQMSTKHGLHRESTYAVKTGKQLMNINYYYA